MIKSPLEVEMTNSVLQSFSRPHLACSAKNEMNSLEYYLMNFRQFTASLNRPFTTVIRDLFNLKFNHILEPAVFHRITYVNLISNGPYANTVFCSNHWERRTGYSVGFHGPVPVNPKLDRIRTEKLGNIWPEWTNSEKFQFRTVPAYDQQNDWDLVPDQKQQNWNLGPNRTRTGKNP